ncbi:MAG: ATP-binding cassette domain-containing protein [Actinobacteria bacterium]|nr:ATP-binding cassette domain-containing protein [Actinomycetota bacterium]
MSEAVVFENVTFTYPGAPSPALERVNLRIEEGSFVLVTGPTGSGKSTFLRAINGLVPHFSGGTLSGSVTVEGRSTVSNAPRALADVVAFVPQDPGAAFVVDRVEDELAYGMENLGVPPSVMRRRVEETLDLLDIEPLRGRSVRSISGGERQRVAIAAALTVAPRVLVLDEPTSQLDPQGAEDVLAALQRLVHDLGLTVMMAEHRLERVAGFVDFAVGCRGGRGVAGSTAGRASVVSGPPSEVLEAVGTGPPVARLGRLVGWRPLPLTVREARRAAASAGAQSKVGAASAGAPLIHAHLSAAYGDRTVLERVALVVRPGEIVGVVGRNGAGKTTLLRSLAGVHPASAGSVAVQGGRAPRPGSDVALCPQDPDSLLFKETVQQEVEATLRARGKAGPSTSPASGAETLLEELGLADLADRHPRDLSAGQRLLVAVAATVAAGAPLLLLDEPTRGLDVESKARLAGLLRGFARAGRAVIFATHDVELVAEVATRVVMLASGEVVADGVPGEVIGDSPVFSPQIARAFGPRWLTPEAAATGILQSGSTPAGVR